MRVTNEDKLCGSLRCSQHLPTLSTAHTVQTLMRIGVVQPCVSRGILGRTLPRQETKAGGGGASELWELWDAPRLWRRWENVPKSAHDGTVPAPRFSDLSISPYQYVLHHGPDMDRSSSRGSSPMVNSRDMMRYFLFIFLRI